MADYDALLARWPVPYQIHVVPTVLGATSVVSSGPATAPHLVLLHGSGTHAMSWLIDIEAYAQRFRTHVVDTPGDPGRSAGTIVGHRSSRYARWLSDVLDGLAIERTHVVGASMGGWNAVTFASTFPHRVCSLALLAPAGISPPKTRFMLAAAPLLVLGSSGQRVLDRWIAGGRLDQRALNYVDHLAHDLRPRIDIPRIFTDSELRSLRMPLLAVVGDRDAIFATHRVAGRLHRLLPQATVLVVPGAGHALLGLAAPVVDFLVRGRSCARPFTAATSTRSCSRLPT
jgi:pimeloyl-ACP methyl ester carboxylesterase